MPSVYKMLQLEELKKNFIELAKKELEKHGASDDNSKLPKDRRGQLELIDATIDAHASNREVIGAMLFVKAQIHSDYEKSAKESYLPFYNYIFKPSNSLTYSGIDKAIGVTKDNELDGESEAFLIESFKSFYSENKEKFNLDAATLKQINDSLFDKNSNHKNVWDNTKTFVKPENYDDTVNLALKTNVEQVDSEYKAKAMAVQNNEVEPGYYNSRLSLFKELKHFDKDSLKQVANDTAAKIAP